ncbi:radical SAM/SPASM domain-containing protein [[Eubacterium] cellulosolvens]
MSDIEFGLLGLRHKMSDLMDTNPPPPFSVTLSVTNLCNSRCMTCKIWAKKGTARELETKEWEKILSQIGPHVKFYTFSGGEPFMRDDLAELLYLPFKYGSPHYLTLSTNCLLSEKIRYQLENFYEMLGKKKFSTKIYCKVSVNAIGKQHDRTRGIEGNFSKVLQTIEYLREIRAKRRGLKIGIHTVISRFNLNEVKNIYDYFIPLPYVDSMTCDIAERRYELMNTEEDIAPSPSAFKKATSIISKMLSQDKRMDKNVKSLRINYYDFVNSLLTTNRLVMPCFAGRASCHITSTGEVVACAVRWSEKGFMGDLREKNYDFMNIWHSDKASLVRKTIRAHECACPLSNAYYTTLVCNPNTWLKFLFKRAHYH